MFVYCAYLLPDLSVCRCVPCVHSVHMASARAARCAAKVASPRVAAAARCMLVHVLPEAHLLHSQRTKSSAWEGKVFGVHTQGAAASTAAALAGDSDVV